MTARSTLEPRVKYVLVQIDLLCSKKTTRELAE